MSKDLYYKGEFKREITNEEASEIMEFRGYQLTFKGELLKKTLIEIFNKKQEGFVDYAKINYLKEFEAEQETIKLQTPEEKTFRNYKSLFCWKYLLQFGVSNFFGNEDWKKESAHDIFKKFDNKLREANFETAKKFTDECDEYFKRNSEEIWVSSEILDKFLPKGNRSIGKSRENLCRAMS